MANSIFDQQDEELEDAYRYARLSPSEQIALRQRQAEQGVVAGAENVMRGGLGLPPSEDRNRGQAGLELRELAKKVRMGTEEFYTAAIDIFRKYGLIGEAEQMAKALNALEIGKAGQHSPTLKLQRDRDELQKRLDKGDVSVKPGIEAIDRQLKLLGTRAEGSKQADPEFVKLLDQYEAALEAGQGDRAATLKKAIDAWIKQKEKSGEPASTAALDYKKERDAKKDADAQTTAANAVVGLIRLVDGQLQAANRLISHPGLSLITGPRYGTKLGREVSAFVRGQAANALVILEQVMAQSFIQAIQDLKATSKTGATSLGQLTEREGDKIQAAKAALDPRQETQQFKRSLQSFIDTMNLSRREFADALTRLKVAPPAPLPPIVDSPAAAPVAAPAGAAARAAAARPAAPTPTPTKKPKLTATRVE